MWYSTKINYRKSLIRSRPCIILDPNFLRLVLEQGVLRSIWSGRLECFFVDPKGAKISKNGNNIICTS